MSSNYDHSRPLHSDLISESLPLVNIGVRKIPISPAGRLGVLSRSYRMTYSYSLHESLLGAFLVAMTYKGMEAVLAKTAESQFQ